MGNFTELFTNSLIYEYIRWDNYKTTIELNFKIFDNMGRKRTISSVLDENPTTTRSSRVTIRSIVQPGNRNKVPYHCSECNGMLVYPWVKNWHGLLEEVSSNVSEVINELSGALEDSEIQDNKPFEVLENTENNNNESS